MRITGKAEGENMGGRHSNVERKSTAVYGVQKESIRIIAALAAFTALACAGAIASAPKYKIKIGSYLTPSSVWGRNIQKTIENVRARTNGEVEIVHLHSGMLGSTKNMLEQVLMGGIQAAGVPSSDLATMVPEAHIIEMPFLFANRDEAYYLLDKVIVPELKKKLDKKGLVVPAFMEVGFMEFVMNRAIHGPEDIKKTKIGSWESPVHVAFWKAVGGNPLPIPATEVFRAYSTGMVDSGANTMSAQIAWDSLFGKAIDRTKIHITPINFSYQSGVLVFNKKYWDSMPAAYRNIFSDELNKLTMKIRDDLRKADPVSVETLKKRGYPFHALAPKERQNFINLSQKVYKEFEPKIGKAFLSKVLAARERYRKTKNK